MYILRIACWWLECKCLNHVLPRLGDFTCQIFTRQDRPPLDRVAGLRSQLLLGFLFGDAGVFAKIKVLALAPRFADIRSSVAQTSELQSN